jgi:hypothetical protein
LDTGYADPRRATLDAGGVYTRLVSSRTCFTANGAGTTSTIVGAVPAPATNDNNIMRRGDRFKLFTSAGVLKEETVFEVTNISAAGGTITFAPLAAVATASGDFARLVGTSDIDDPESLDSALTAFSATVYSADRLAQMTINDKIFAFRQALDPGSI